MHVGSHFFGEKKMCNLLWVCDPSMQVKTRGVYHTVALPFTLKKYLKATEELWKLKYFTMQKYT